MGKQLVSVILGDASMLLNLNLANVNISGEFKTPYVRINNSGELELKNRATNLWHNLYCNNLSGQVALFISDSGHSIV